VPLKAARRKKMNKVRFGYVKLAAMVVVLVMAVVPSMRPSSAKSQPGLPVVPDADLRNEERIIARYCDDLATYDKEVVEFGKRARFVNADLDPVLRKSEILKGRLSEVQSAVREVVRKLKAANEWDELNENFARKITYTDGRKTFLQQSSFKQLLEEFPNGNYRRDIESPLEDLRKRLTSRHLTDQDFQIVRASYEAPAPAYYFEKLQCGLGKIRLKVSVNNGNLPSDDVFRNVWINCNVGQVCCPFTN
jgi:hypothetical protein